MSKIYRSTGEGTGAWTLVPDGTDISRSTGSGNSWTNPVSIWRSTGSGTTNWTKVWSKSDPVTLAFTCNASQGWRNNAWRTDNKVRFGAIELVTDGFGGTTFYGDNLTVLEFSADSTTGGYTSTNLQEALAERPYVSSATLSLRRNTGAGDSTISGSTSETLLVGQLNKANGTSMSSYNAGSYVQTTNMQTVAASSLQGWAGNTTRALALPSANLTAFITHVSTKQMWVSEKSTGWLASGSSPSTGDDSSDIYSVCDGSAQTNKPVLTVTLDYVE